jgi:hypothetical protein
MALSEVGICNLALARIGVRQSISSLTNDTSTEAVMCNALYESMRDIVLSDTPWPFAMRTVTLALVEEDPNTDWAYAYRRPTDCLVARRINNNGRFDQTGLIPYEIAGDDEGGLIYTDTEDPVLQYTARVTDTALFPSDFMNVLAWRMAMELSLALSVDNSYRQSSANSYLVERRGCEARIFNEERKDARPDSEFITARS